MTSRFDEVAKKWDEKPRRVKLAQNVSGKMKKAVDFHNKTLLELGCGTGLVGFELLEGARSLVGIDTSSKMVEVFNEKANDFGFSHAKAEIKDLFTDNLESVDIIFSSMAFHHIKETKRALETLYITLNEGGKLLIADLDAEDGSFHGWDADSVFHHGFEREKLRDMILSAGFNTVEFEDITTMNKNGRDYIRLLS